MMRWLLAVLCLTLVACGGDGGGSDVSEEDLTGALLALEDMPSGWSVEPPDEDDEDDDATFCDAAPLAEEIDADATAERDFSGGEAGPFFTQLLSSMDEDEAENGMDYIRDSFDCGEWTDPEDDTVWSLAEISFPDMGDDTAAYRLSTTAGIFTANGNVIIVRDGGLLLMVVHVAIGNLDSELTEELTQKALDKAQDV